MPIFATTFLLIALLIICALGSASEDDFHYAGERRDGILLLGGFFIFMSFIAFLAGY